MAKLTSDRNTIRRDGVDFGFEAAEEIFAGAMVAMNSEGKVVAATGDGKNVIGVAQGRGSAGQKLAIRRGVFRFANDQDGIKLADVGSQCVVVDDQTVAKGDGGAIAGIILDVDESGVWVKI